MRAEYFGDDDGNNDGDDLVVVAAGGANNGDNGWSKLLQKNSFTFLNMNLQLEFTF